MVPEPPLWTAIGLSAIATIAGLVLILVLVAGIMLAIELHLRWTCGRALRTVRAEGILAHLAAGVLVQKPALVSRHGDQVTFWSIEGRRPPVPFASSDVTHLTVQPARVRLAVLRWADGVSVKDAGDAAPEIELALWSERWPMLVPLAGNELARAKEELFGAAAPGAPATR